MKRLEFFASLLLVLYCTQGASKEFLKKESIQAYLLNLHEEFVSQIQSYKTILNENRVNTKTEPKGSTSKDHPHFHSKLLETARGNGVHPSTRSYYLEGNADKTNGFTVSKEKRQTSCLITEILQVSLFL